MKILKKYQWQKNDTFYYTNKDGRGLWVKPVNSPARQVYSTTQFDGSVVDKIVTKMVAKMRKQIVAGKILDQFNLVFALNNSVSWSNVESRLAAGIALEIVEPFLNYWQNPMRPPLEEVEKLGDLYGGSI
jgi:hypothetical protein